MNKRKVSNGIGLDTEPGFVVIEFASDTQETCSAKQSKSGKRGVGWRLEVWSGLCEKEQQKRNIHMLW